MTVISAKNIKKNFGKLEVIKDISLDINEGEVVSIIGPSGSGKSTFLRCLNLLEVPTSGEIYFEDKLVNDPKADIDKIRMQMGMVFQHFNLFPHKTIIQNIALAPIKLKLMSKDEANEKGWNRGHLGLDEGITLSYNYISE